MRPSSLPAVPLGLFRALGPISLVAAIAAAAATLPLGSTRQPSLSDCALGSVRADSENAEANERGRWPGRLAFGHVEFDWPAGTSVPGFDSWPTANPREASRDVAAPRTRTADACAPGVIRHSFSGGTRG